jgi:hypothetical protein
MMVDQKTVTLNSLAESSEPRENYINMLDKVRYRDAKISFVYKHTNSWEQFT